VTKVVPVLLELFAIHASARFLALRIVTVRDEEERFPGGLEAVDEVHRR